MWINQIPCFLLAVTPLFLLNHLVHSQKTDSSLKAQNLTCITHSFDEVICTWTTASVGDFSYEFCYISSTPGRTCLETEKKSLAIPLILFDSLSIEISTLDSSGEVKKAVAKNAFFLTEKNITFIPPTPHIDRLTPDYISDTFELEWYDGGSAFPYEMDATWEIQILYNDPMEEVDLVTFRSRLKGKNTLLYWKWAADLPFNCTTHYVRIRSFFHEDEFAGWKTWSQWSEIVNIPGKDGGMYPLDRVVHVGSSVTFCCVWKNGGKMNTLNFSQCPPHRCPIAPLSTESTTIQVQNVSVTPPGGSNAWCIVETDEGSIPYGTVLFVGYSPDVPQNVSCETRDLKNIVCKWEQGRPTRLYGQRRTIYTLLERISGENVTYTGDGKRYQCHFPIQNNRRIYNFTVHASNDLGQSDASLSIDIKHKVHPQPPEKLTVSDNNPTSIGLSWYLPGSFAEIQLKCQVRVDTSPSAEELNLHLGDIETSHKTNNATFYLDGAENSYYTVSVDSLLPYTSYIFQVRCSAAEPFFWKWSSWRQTTPHRTQEAPPAGQLDIWRERINDGDTVIIFWKSLPFVERNGKIQTYEVSWSLSKLALEKKEVPESNNHTSINLGGSDCVITVVAKNKAGPSPPSLINSAEIAVGDVPTENGVATGDGINITWHPDHSVTCGYTVRWCYGPEPCVVDWKTFPTGVTNAVIKSAHFQMGIRYHFSLYGCKDDGYQLLKHINSYIKELEPRVAPVFNVELATSDSILIKWKDIPVEDARGFLKGYLLHLGKGEEGTTKPNSFESVRIMRQDYSAQIYNFARHGRYTFWTKRRGSALRYKFAQRTKHISQTRQCYDTLRNKLERSIRRNQQMSRRYRRLRNIFSSFARYTYWTQRRYNALRHNFARFTRYAYWMRRRYDRLKYKFAKFVRRAKWMRWRHSALKHNLARFLGLAFWLKRCCHAQRYNFAQCNGHAYRMQQRYNVLRNHFVLLSKHAVQMRQHQWYSGPRYSFPSLAMYAHWMRWQQCHSALGHNCPRFASCICWVQQRYSTSRNYFETFPRHTY